MNYLLRNVSNNKYYWIMLDNIDELEKINNILGTEIMMEDLNKSLVGPKIGFITPWCSNVISIFKSIGIHSVNIIEELKDKVHIDPLLEQVYNSKKELELINKENNIKGSIYTVLDLYEFNNRFSLGFDKQDIDYLKSLGRRLNNIEMYDLAQSGSEHCRHTFFRGKLIGKGIKDLMNNHENLMSLIKEPWRKNRRNSLLAFCDNSSCIDGIYVKNLLYNPLNRKYKIKSEILCPTFTAETHNFPTGICPFPGAATGTGGRIRDIQACGRFGHYLGGITGYCVSKLNDNNELSERGKKILIEASNGASDYGNKFGEPIIQGFCREYTEIINNEIISWDKPIMFSGGIGYTRKTQLYKLNLEEHDLIVKIGGPAYPLGIGGGSASSQGQEEITETNTNRLHRAVQRGNPEMLQKMNRVLRSCSDYESITNNIIIKSIHDQGAGGNANVLKEIVGNNGGIIDLSEFTLGDKSMTDLELWVSEYQESNALIINPKNKELLLKFGKREKVDIDIVGTISNNTKKIIVYKTTDNGDIKQLVDLPSIEPPKKSYLIPMNIDYKYISLTKNQNLEEIFKRIDVGSKRFLTNKVDRSVGGLVAQQQCIGPWLTPLSNVGIMSLEYSINPSGIATSIGEQPLKGSNCGISAVIEMLTNMIWTIITDLKDIKCSGNWMWAVKKNAKILHPESRQLIEQARQISDFMCELGIAIDGGKDSLSMHSLKRINNEIKLIKCPNQIVISGYVLCPDVTKVITPELKNNNSDIIYIPIDKSNISFVFYKIQNLWKMYKNKLYLFAGHDVSDGGLITCLCEMALSSCYGLNVICNLWDENHGLVISIPNKYFTNIENYFIKNKLQFIKIGKTTDKNTSVILNNKEYSLNELRSLWEYTSSNLEKEQCLSRLVDEEYKYLCSLIDEPRYYLPNNFWDINDIPDYTNKKVAIIREEGSNGDREMAAAFYTVGFNVYDVCMTDIINGKVILNDFDGLVFVGGFSYSDVLGPAKGWELVIKNKLFYQFDNFRKDSNKFILGVCNGCQLLVRLGWLGIPNLKIIKNDSNRFESRQITVKIKPNNNIFLQGFDNAILPIHIAHYEGKFIGHVPKNQIVMKYCNPYNGKSTNKYPLSPNGSYIAGISDKTGRILGIMPHPERCFQKWQFHWIDRYSYKYWKKSPWLRLFENLKK